jgi:hypothetical protein
LIVVTPWLACYHFNYFSEKGGLIEQRVSFVNAPSCADTLAFMSMMPGRVCLELGLFNNKFVREGRT